jgi:hypothetical protein
LVDFECFLGYFEQFDRSVCAEPGIEVELAGTDHLRTETVDLVLAVWLVVDVFRQTNHQWIALKVSIAVEHFQVDGSILAIGDGAGSIHVAVEEGSVGAFGEFISKHLRQ